MATEIHARLRDGKWEFALWSTVVDAYVTTPGDEDYARKIALGDALAAAADDFMRTWPDRAQRAKERGTSSRVSEAIDVAGPWEEERE